MSPRRRLPIAGAPTPSSVTVATEEASLELFAEGGSSLVGEHALGWHAEATSEVWTRFVPKRSIGCVEGCAYCCHLKVIASPVEVIHLARHLRRTRTAEGLRTLVEKLRIANASTNGLGTQARARIRLPCPLLENARCSAYEARPLHCAGANAYDPSECRAAFDDVERDLPVAIYQPQAQLADVIAAGISRASFGAGRAGAMLELIAGLLLALEDPEREEAWERGEDSFATARDLELEALIQGGGAPPPT